MINDFVILQSLEAVFLKLAYDSSIGDKDAPNDEKYSHTKVHNCLSYSTVVLYIGIMKVWRFWPKIITPKPA